MVKNRSVSVSTGQCVRWKRWSRTGLSVSVPRVSAGRCLRLKRWSRTGLSVSVSMYEAEEVVKNRSVSVSTGQCVRR